MSTQERRKVMLAAASQTFAAAPYSEVTTAVLAESCEASEGLIFHYFGSKAGLYAAVVEEAIDKLGRAQKEAIELLGPFVSSRDRVRATLEVYLEHIRAHPEAWAAPLLGGHEPPEAIEIRARARESYVQELSQMLGVSGWKRHSYAVSGYFGFLDGACLAWVREGCPEGDRFALIDAALGALEGALGDWRV